LIPYRKASTRMYHGVLPGCAHSANENEVIPTCFKGGASSIGTSGNDGASDSEASLAELLRPV